MTLKLKFRIRPGDFRLVFRNVYLDTIFIKKTMIWSVHHWPLPRCQWWTCDLNYDVSADHDKHASSKIDSISLISWFQRHLKKSIRTIGFFSLSQVHNYEYFGSRIPDPRIRSQYSEQFSVNLCVYVLEEGQGSLNEYIGDGWISFWFPVCSRSQNLDGLEVWPNCWRDTDLKVK